MLKLLQRNTSLPDGQLLDWTVGNCKYFRRTVASPDGKRVYLLLRLLVTCQLSKAPQLPRLDRPLIWRTALAVVPVHATPAVATPAEQNLAAIW